MTDETDCPWCHEPARDARGETFVCDDEACPVAAFVDAEVPAHA